MQNSGGLLSRFTGNGGGHGEDTAHTTNRITSFVRKAALGRLTFLCEIQGTERELLVLSGPSQHLNRKGIERGRKWLEEQTGSMEVRGGDSPVHGPNSRPTTDCADCHTVDRCDSIFATP
jgi:tubulin-like protein CetZ